jgi:hypothetical protein
MLPQGMVEASVHAMQRELRMSHLAPLLRG